MATQTAPLGVDAFFGEGRSLNFEAFTNLEKGISQVDFLDTYGKGHHRIFTKAQLESYVDGVMEKAKGPDSKPEELMAEAKKQLARLKPVNVKLLSGEMSRVFVLEKAVTDDLQKGEFSDALGYDSGKMGFKKSGKELKEKVNALLTRVSTAAATHLTAMNDLTTKIGFMPVENIDDYETRGCPDECKSIKRYNWECCYYSEPRAVGHIGTTDVNKSGDVKTASSKEEATNCRNYNDLTRKYLDTMRDKAKAEAFVRNMDDKKSYDLSLSQITALGF